MPAGPGVRLGVISLGCAKNLVDTERALGQLTSEGVVVVEDLRDADWILINTCGFIEDAKIESINTVLEMAELKNENPGMKIAVAGCLSQRYGDTLSSELGEIGFLTGILTRENVAEFLRVIAGKSSKEIPSEDADRGRLRITPRHFAYLRISEGCDNRCAYCAIPDIRGPLRSRPFESVIADAGELLADGAVELNVIAQDTTTYGVDLYGKMRLAEILSELRTMNPRGWIRLLYAHPAHIGDDVIAELAKGPPLVPYVDLPLQHINDRLLALMGRKVTRARAEDLIGEIRSRIDGVYIRTTFIVGFPSETQAEFDELLRFIQETRFERLGAFRYSREEGTPAAAFPDQIDAAEADRRLDLLMRTQAEIAAEFNHWLVGTEITGIIDSDSGRDDYLLEGRTYGDAPEVDGTVFVRGGAEMGKIVKLRVTGVEDYDLLAEEA